MTWRFCDHIWKTKMLVQVSLGCILMRKKERQISTTWRTALLLLKSFLLSCLRERRKMCRKVFKFITLVLREDLRIDLSSIIGFRSFLPISWFFVAFYFLFALFFLFCFFLVWEGFGLCSPSPFVFVSFYLYILRVLQLVHHVYHLKFWMSFCGNVYNIIRISKINCNFLTKYQLNIFFLWFFA